LESVRAKVQVFGARKMRIGKVAQKIVTKIGDFYHFEFKTIYRENTIELKIQGFEVFWERNSED
jgi:hypothetical protein